MPKGNTVEFFCTMFSTPYMHTDATIYTVSANSCDVSSRNAEMFSDACRNAGTVALSSMVAPSSCIVFALSAPGCTCNFMSRYSDAAPSSHTASPIIVTPSPVDDHVVSPPHKALSLPVDDDVEDCCIPVGGCELGLLTSFYEDKVSLPTECCKVLSTISDDSFYKGGFGMSPIFLSKVRDYCSHPQQ
ncbi:hypothetical protein BC332_02923 [Capsicum chinense]|nr:hypothetical protein BC332_02923 [Capsicum chinense]